MTQEETPKDESFRDHLSSVDQKGKRVWIYPKKPSGRFFNYRKWLSYVLLIILFGLPWIQVNGEPWVLLDVINRRFILFGVHFVPQDFHIFAIGMLILILFIVLFTVVFGRVFCGWICPQTIFMEMVFRRIEYWIEGDYTAQKRLIKQDWNWEKIWKKTSKQAIFIGIAFLIGNTFLAYLIGLDELFTIIQEPVSEHWVGFTSILFFTGAFYGVFAFLREQVCTTICPYGRLQGVMLDKNSLAVYYDWIRGEPRGKLRKQATSLESEERGDCIDCGLCVKVCPTGIDIRNGIQLECVNCTACMDACDEVMDKIDRPRGLIRIDSHEGIASKQHNYFNLRTVAYSIVLVILIGLEVFLFASRSPVETIFLRTPGKLYYEREKGTIENLYNYELINKTRSDQPIEFEIIHPPRGTIEFAGNAPLVEGHSRSSGSLFLKFPKEELDSRKTRVRIRVTSNGKILDEFTTNFMGPIK